MQALGMIETRGTLAAIEAVDVMLKAADVTLVEKTKIGGGLVTVTVTGDVAAVEAAIERAKAAVADQGMYLDSSVIAHPDAQIREAIL